MGHFGRQRGRENGRGKEAPLRDRIASAVGLLLVVGVAAAALPVRASTPVPQPAPLQYLDDEEDCLQATPAEYSINDVTDDGRTVSLEVLVLLDELPEWRGPQIFERVIETYEPLGIDVRPTFREVSVPPDSTVTDPDGSTSGVISTASMFAWVKEQMGGYRPYGTDLVYVATGKELEGSVAGKADCIGGVRYPNEAFAVGEAFADPSEEDQGQFVYAESSAKVAAHEIGHLLGAHHHYGNCAESEKEALLRAEPSTCTLMFPDTFFITLSFSTPNAAVVRGHALAYADDTPVGSVPVDRRTLSVTVTKKLAEGRLTDDADEYMCTSFIPLELQRKVAGGWEEVASGETFDDGSYEIEGKMRKGTYRAIATEETVHGADGWVTCAAVSSSETKRA